MITKLAIEKCKVDKIQEIAARRVYFVHYYSKDRIMLFCCFMHGIYVPGQFVTNSVNLKK